MAGATAAETYARLRGGPANKEITYGWYPPAKNIWKTYGVKTSSYDQECLFKHSRSRYKSGEAGVSTPVAPTPIRMALSPRPEARPASSQRPLGMTRAESRAQRAASPTRSASRAASSRPATPAHSPWAAPALQLRPASAARDSAGSRAQRFIKRVKSAPVSRTPLTPQPDNNESTATPKPPCVVAARASQPSQTCVPDPSAPQAQPLTDTLSPEPLHMPTPPPDSPTRPERVRSAHPRIQNSGVPRAPAQVLYPRPFSASPAPPTHERYATLDSGPVERPPSSVEPPQSPEPEEQPSYEEQLQKYGWRAQVHGDPLRLKEPTIKERKPFTVQVPDAPATHEGPRAHMQCWDTYFYNTIPRRRATFDVHKDWISEVIHAKRLELQKRDGGIKYRYKNFAFAY